MNEKKEYIRMFFLKNTYENLEGLEFQGYKLINADLNWLKYWISDSEINERLKSEFFYDNNAYCSLFYKQINNINKFPNKFAESFNIALHIYSSINTYITLHVFARRLNNKILGTAGDGFSQIHVFGELPFENSVAINKEELQIFLNKYNYDSFNNSLKSAIDFFYLCLQTYNTNLRFVLLISILEILFSPTDTKTELKYRSTRNAAIFLGKTNNESRLIFEKLGKFYDYRSQFIHCGSSKKITQETLFELSEYVRIILKHMIINTATIEDKRSYNNILHESAFGSNPFNIDSL